jgi:hypothetical protein
MKPNSTTHLIGERVEVYWNLHKDCFSVRALSGPDKGRVVAHTRHIDLGDVTFVVQPAGRARVLAEGRKNVHAFARGTVTASRDGLPTSYTEVVYNPYATDAFVARDDLTRRFRWAGVVRAYTDNRGRPVLAAA